MKDTRCQPFSICLKSHIMNLLSYTKHGMIISPVQTPSGRPLLLENDNIMADNTLPPSSSGEVLERSGHTKENYNSDFSPGFQQ